VKKCFEEKFTQLMLFYEHSNLSNFYRLFWSPFLTWTQTVWPVFLTYTLFYITDFSKPLY